MGKYRPVTIVWSAAATRDLHQVMEYLQGEGSAGSTSVRRRILETVKRIGQIPNSGRVGRVPKTREAGVPRSPFIVVYEGSAQAVGILGIWHGARQWPDSF
jgi:toxin ParE1/3/4